MKLYEIFPLEAGLEEWEYFTPKSRQKSQIFVWKEFYGIYYRSGESSNPYLPYGSRSESWAFFAGPAPRCNYCGRATKEHYCSGWCEEVDEES